MFGDESEGEEGVGGALGDGGGGGDGGGREGSATARCARLIAGVGFGFLLCHGPTPVLR